MANLSEHLDDITKIFWETWRNWRYGQGWRLGPDNPKALLSPFLVDNFDQLGEEGRAWFQQHAALVLWAIGAVSKTEKPVAPPADIVKLALTKIERQDMDVAILLLEEAISALGVSKPDVTLLLREASNRLRFGPWSGKAQHLTAKALTLL